MRKTAFEFLPRHKPTCTFLCVSFRMKRLFAEETISKSYKRNRLINKYTLFKSSSLERLRIGNRVRHPT